MGGATPGQVVPGNIRSLSKLCSGVGASQEASFVCGLASVPVSSSYPEFPW